MSEFSNIYARQIFDSRGYPTIACKVTLACGASGEASVPAGASKGSMEVLELRDNTNVLAGKSVYKAIEIINKKALSALKDCDPLEQVAVDQALQSLDGSDNLSNIGGNTALAISLATAKAAAQSKQQELFAYLAGEQQQYSLPLPFINLINGGMHAGNSLGIQEFMIVPAGFTSFSEAMMASFEVFYCLRQQLKACGVGDEGGFAPNFSSSRQGLEALIAAIEQAGFKPGQDIYLALDVAASELYQDEIYSLPSENIACTFEGWADWLEVLTQDYPICSIEDGMAEQDLAGWQYLTSKLSERVQLVGDDVFVTQMPRLQWGISEKIANSILIKPNQVGTLTDTLLTWTAANNAGYKTMISHRSGDTADTFIADLAVGTNAGQIKTGGLCRSERIEKYNRLLEIELILGAKAKFAGQAQKPVSKV